MTPTLTDDEIRRRVPLWEALANLYLDTEDQSFVPHIIAQARISGFTLAEVDHILRWEVRPALYHNYLDIAGEWAGWPKDWLVERILRAIETRPSAIIGQKRFMPDEWPQIQAAMS